MSAPLPRWRRAQIGRLLALALLPLLLSTASGHGVERVLWSPPPVVLVGRVRRHRRLPLPCRRTAGRWVGRVAAGRLPLALLQASLIGLLLWGKRAAPLRLLLASLPLLRWLLTLSALIWPTWGQCARCQMLRQILAEIQLARILGLGLTLVWDWTLPAASSTAALVVARPPRRPKPTAIGRVLDDGAYAVVLGETFAIRHKPRDEFDRRMFLRFLRDSHLVDRPSKRPFVCQVWLAEWFGTLQELISRWEDYRAAGDWQRLMSRRAGPLMPLDQQQVIIQVWARHLWWSVDEVTAHLGDLGVDVCASRVEQVGRESGLRLARRVLRERFHLEPALLRPKDDWLVQRLFAVIDQL